MERFSVTAAVIGYVGNQGWLEAKAWQSGEPNDVAWVLSGLRPSRKHAVLPPPYSIDQCHPESSNHTHATHQNNLEERPPGCLCPETECAGFTLAWLEVDPAQQDFQLYGVPDQETRLLFKTRSCAVNQY